MVLASPWTTLPASGAGDDPAGIAFFEKRIRPVLVEECYECHSDQSRRVKGGLFLDSRRRLLDGGDSGPAIQPGKPEESLLVSALTYEDENLQMPPQRKLTDEELAGFVAWVRMGAPWPEEEEAEEASARQLEEATAAPLTDEARRHWAFQPVRRPSVPEFRRTGGSDHPIDAFVLAGLEARGLEPNPPASWRELIRRAHYDLTGLPPSPEEVEAFLAAPSLEAYEALIDDLLDSPRYGEKWGRHWLDLVRFAETNSYERDNPKPNAWRYRDYVIDAFNQDKPYDRFILEQLAGDELPDSNNEALIATGYYRLGIWDDEPTDREQARYDGLDDIITTTGQVFLGLTIDCARCHDHKIDPFPQTDYYRLLAFFNNVNHFRNGGPTDEVPLFDDPEDRMRYDRAVDDLQQRRAETKSALVAWRQRFQSAYRKQAEATGATDPGADDLAKLIRREGPQLLGEEQMREYERLASLLKKLEGETIPVEKALCVTEAGASAPDTHVLIRGNANAKGERVEPGFPEILDAGSPAMPALPPDAPSSGRRLVLANWIASPTNPLTARVMVNRIWQHHFGRGIVRSPNNFGLKGFAPTHPELLDWLAAEFAEGGWRLKPLHRAIMTSRTYRMSSRTRPAALAADPENTLFWRFNPRRLSAEEVRDTLLSVSGNLNLAMHGPGVYVEIPPEILAGQSQPGKGWGNSTPENQARRSVYIHVKRSLLTPILESFDLAETDRTTPVRFASIQPTQALGLLNGAFASRQAETFAERLRSDHPGDRPRQIERAFELATARDPGPHEIRRSLELMDALMANDGCSEETALRYFCLMVFNLNETLYLD